MTDPANTVTVTLYETGNRPEQAAMLRSLADVLERQHQADQEAAAAPQEGPERLPWHYYAPELRTRLKQLANRFAAQTIADAAAELAALIAEHGPRVEQHLAELDAAEARRR